MITTDDCWNWCSFCEQLVDADDVHDGSEVRCIGCERWYVVVSYEEGPWQLAEIYNPDAPVST